MILSDRDIKKKLADGDIKVSPAPDFETQLGTTSLDFRLGSKFRVFKPTSTPYLDPQNPRTQEVNTSVIDVSDAAGEQPLPNVPEGPRTFVLHPGEFVLATTIEKIELPNDIAGRLEGRSSLGRMGIVIHSTAGHFDPGFAGNIVLEVTNIGVVPVLLYPGMRFCQMVFEQLSSPVETSYAKRKSSKYAGQTGPTSSRISKEQQEIGSSEDLRI
ncbi:MAG: dCTP deaminase [Patescibacteria group bacterium]